MYSAVNSRGVVGVIFGGKFERGVVGVIFGDVFDG